MAAAAAAASEWGFTGVDDAAAYLRDVQRLWTAWVAGLAVLMTGSLAFVVAGGVVVIALLIRLVRPLQRRAEALAVPDEPHRDGDRLLQALAYGEAPLREAVDLTGRSRAWLLGRRAMLGVTVVAFAIVVLQTFDG